MHCGDPRECMVGVRVYESGCTVEEQVYGRGGMYGGAECTVEVSVQWG